MNDPKQEYSETMHERVQELAFLQQMRKSIEDGMNSMEHVILLKTQKANLKRQLDDIDTELVIECSDSTRELDQIDTDISAAKSQILGAWDGGQRTLQYNDFVLSLRGRKSVVVVDSGVLLADLMAHFSAERVAEEFVSTFNKKNLKRFMDLHPQDASVALVEETIHVYVNPRSEQQEV